MYRELIRKELREVGWMAGLVFVYFLYVVWSRCTADSSVLKLSGVLSTVMGGTETPPFLSMVLVSRIVWVGFLLGAAIGLWQTLTEERHGTWLFLLHRPLPRRQIVLTKLLVGLGLTWLSIGIPLVIYALWAATKGKEQSPFYWWMAGPAILAWGATSLSYLGAFLSGMRPARWYVSRFWPLISAGIIVLCSALAIHAPVWLRVLLLMAGTVTGLLAIFSQLRTRDFG